MHGWRARIGLIVPSPNTVAETEFWRMAPEGVTIHTTRMLLRADEVKDPLRDMEQFLPRVLEELRRVAKDGVSEAELAKAQNIMLANYWRGLATIDGKAEILGQYEVFHGDYEKLFELPAALEAVAAEDLREVANSVFRSSNMTVGVLRAPTAENEQ